MWRGSHLWIYTFCLVVLSVVVILFVIVVVDFSSDPEKQSVHDERDASHTIREHFLSKEDSSLPETIDPNASRDNPKPIQEEIKTHQLRSITVPEGADPKYLPLFEGFRKSILSRHSLMIQQTMNQIHDMGDEGIPWLKQLIRETEFDRVRAHCVTILGSKNRNDLLDFFVNLLDNDTSEYVRTSASWSLGRLNNKSVLPRLRRIVETDTSKHVRQEAQKAIQLIEESNKEESR